MRFFCRRVSSGALLLLGVFGGPSAAEDQWSDPFVGVRYLVRTTPDPKWTMHAAFVDLTEPSIRLTATPPGDPKTTISGFAKKKGVQIAINAAFIDFEKNTSYGSAMGEGKLWTEALDQQQSAQIAAGPGNRVEIFEQGLIFQPQPWMRDVVSGHPMFVWNGAAYDAGDGVMAPRHPRTAVALSKDRRTLILFVVDGRQKHSVGMTGAEMSRVFIDLGAWQAMNMDGGGSSAMYLDGKGIVNSPSDGRERSLINHLGVYAAAGASKPKGQVKGIVKEKGTGKPLANAKVSLTSAYFDVTHADGFYHLSQVPAGQAALTATLDGYETAKVRVKVEARQTAAAADIELTPKPPPAPKVTPTAAGAAETGKQGSGETGAGAGGEEAARMMAKAKNYASGKLWGKAIDSYREVETKFPGTLEAAAAKEEIAKIEAVLADPAPR